MFQGDLVLAKFYLKEQIFPGLRLLKTALSDAQKHIRSKKDSDNVASLLHHAERMENRAEKMRGKLDDMTEGHTAKSIIHEKTTRPKPLQ